MELKSAGLQLEEQAWMWFGYGWTVHWFTRCMGESIITDHAANLTTSLVWEGSLDEYPSLYKVRTEPQPFI
ncbi:hypothetical protein SNOG_14656 [Parastagonospora nodorum SN15]|uniref:Uncharacterized protein n=1 Tax=Phaeosphaeria nodorum (strain SN15 / ATCC MYA-4574 / FGSC 10173) TaxID=321614 RepID=Q0U0D7_PHANO|nr:hypothetical protein SNOG_14656 [Parastagonospora nodorum SN15]EAT77848.1 hypothetical protein SNOG_14656 [Parastagonospora nodorum SN15]